MDTIDTETLRLWLLAARALLTEPERWTKEWSARDREGGCTNAHDLAAVCWCLVGALAVTCPTRTELGAQSPWVQVITALGMPGTDAVVEFNDRPSTTHADVLAVLDAAVARLPEAA